jgi:hypothetical protein
MRPSSISTTLSGCTLGSTQSIRPHEKGLSPWRPTRAEIGDTRFNSGTEAEIGLPGKRRLLVV